MTCVIINDASCLFDLRKGRLLHAVVQLPYRFVIPLPVRQSEILDFTAQEWQIIDDGGFETYDLPDKQVAEAMSLRQQKPRLSANDCFCLISTRHHENGILLTGDSYLRKAAESENLEAHGVLWIIDELAEVGITKELLISALEIWRNDPLVFLPNDLIVARIKRLRDL